MRSSPPPGEAAGGYAAAAGESSVGGAALRELMGAALARGVSFRFTAPGWSMDPFIRDGDVLTVAPCGAPPRLGDVVAFTPQGAAGVVVHRVVGRPRGRLLVRGDGAMRADGLVSRSAVLGVVKRVERGGRDVTVGLGPERVVVASLSRIGLVVPAVRVGRRARQALRRRAVHTD